jgi:hypothetical protein
MNSLKDLSDESLHATTKSLVREERRLSLEILHHLAEIERRMLYAKLKHSNLWEYCRQELGYSEGCTQRRIDSLRLLKAVPEVEEKVLEGALTLSHLSQAQGFFRREEIQAPTIKREILEELEGKSTRESERLLMSHAEHPERHVAPERVRQVSQELTEVRFNLDQATMEKLEELKALLSHASPNLSLKEVFQYGLELALTKHRVKKPKQTGDSPPAVAAGEVHASSRFLDSSPAVAVGRAQASPQFRDAPPTLAVVSDRVSPRDPSAKSLDRITAETKRIVYHRDQGQCTYRNPSSRARCESKRFLDFDHIIPRARGGLNTPGNLRLRCRTHNKLAAVEILGLSWMARYCPSLR